MTKETARILGRFLVHDDAHNLFLLFCDAREGMDRVSAENAYMRAREELGAIVRGQPAATSLDSQAPAPELLGIATGPTREPYRRTEHSSSYGMNLPDGKTCGDCVHIRRCGLIFGHIPQDETCDWSPSRFREKAESERCGMAS